MQLSISKSKKSQLTSKEPSKEIEPTQNKETIVGSRSKLLFTMVDFGSLELSKHGDKRVEAKKQNEHC